MNASNRALCEPLKTDMEVADGVSEELTYSQSFRAGRMSIFSILAALLLLLKETDVPEA